MIIAKMFAAQGGKVRGLQQIGADLKLGAVPGVGDYINSGVAAEASGYRVEGVVFLDGEDGVRLIVSQLAI